MILSGEFWQIMEKHINSKDICICINKQEDVEEEAGNIMGITYKIG